jgi:hypothetical protein
VSQLNDGMTTSNGEQQPVEAFTPNSMHLTDQKGRIKRKGPGTSPWSRWKVITSYSAHSHSRQFKKQACSNNIQISRVISGKGR